MLNGDWWTLSGSRLITGRLRKLVDEIAAKHPKDDVRVVGMCLTGAMPLALLGHPRVNAAVVAQPTLPFIVFRDSLGISGAEWEEARKRVLNGKAKVYGVRFFHDTIARREKHCRLRKELGNGFVDAEITPEEYKVRDEAGRLIYEVPEDAHSSLVVDWIPYPRHPSEMRRKEIEVFLKDPMQFDQSQYRKGFDLKAQETSECD